MGSFVPWLYYSFYCDVVPQIFYFILIFTLGGICIFVSMWDKFSDPKFRPVRAGESFSVLPFFKEYALMFPLSFMLSISIMGM